MNKYTEEDIRKFKVLDGMNTFYQQTHKGIKIISPTKSLLVKMRKCLDMIVKKDEGLKTILITPTRGNGFGLYEQDKTLVVERGYLDCEDNWLASCLVHEFRHAYQNREWSYKDNENWDKCEKDAAKCQETFLFRADREDLIKHLNKQLKKKWWKKDGKNYAEGEDILSEWLMKYKERKLRATKVS